VSKKLNAGAMHEPFLLRLTLVFVDSSVLHGADKMTVTYATLGPALSPGWVTSEKRIWGKYGLDVELVYLGGGARVVPALLGGVNTSQVLLEKNRDMFIRFLKGYLEGIRFMIGNKEESLKAFTKYLKNSDPAVNNFLYDDITTRVEKDLRPNPESVRLMLDLIALDHPQAQRVSDKDFWDLSLLDEIQRSGFVQRLYRK